MRFIAGVCWLFYLWEFTDSIPKGRERIMNLHRVINAFALISMLTVATAIGIASYIFLPYYFLLKEGEREGKESEF